MTAATGSSQFVCGWCTEPFTPRTRRGWRFYCDRRCRQAMQDWRRRGVGTPGRKPKVLGPVLRPYRRYQR